MAFIGHCAFYVLQNSLYIAKFARKCCSYVVRILAQSDMITFKPEVFSHQRRKDGTYNVKIRVTFNRQVRRIPTNLFCSQSDLTRSLKLKDGNLINKANGICNEMRGAVAHLSLFELEGRDIDWVIAYIKRVLSNESFRLDYFEYAESFLKSKTPQTAKTYEVALNSFARFLGERSIDINAITSSLVKAYVEDCNNSQKMTFNRNNGKTSETAVKKRANSSALYTVKLACIFESAKDKYNDDERVLIPRSPFKGIDTKLPPSNGQKCVGKEVIQKMIDAEVDDWNIRTALDIFLISFGTMGANMADLWEAKVSGGTWVYNRRKTRGRRSDKAEMRVVIVPELKPFIDRQSGDGEWWLNRMRDYAPAKDICTAKVNKYLTRWCEANEIEPFTFYAARHTMATLMRAEGVEKATVDECLCHIGDYNMTDIYAERDWKRINDANRKVIDIFNW